MRLTPEEREALELVCKAKGMQDWEELDQSLVSTAVRVLLDKDDPKILAIAEAASRFVELGDEGIFMTSESCGSEFMYRVVLKCKDIHHLQSVHQSIIDLVKAVRDLDEPPVVGRSSGLTDKEMESVGNAFDAVRDY